MDTDDDFTFCQVSSQEGVETKKLASDIADISIKEESSSSPTISSNQDGGFLWKDGFANNSDSIKEDKVGSLSFTVTSATSRQPNELNKKSVLSDGMNSIQRSPELKSPVAKPAARTKVPFEKGYSQMDWLKLTRTHPDLAGLKGQSNKRLIPMDEVRKHQTEGEMWTVLKGHVYNISPYMKFHPGDKMAARNQTKDLKCVTHLLSDKFRNMTEEKKAIVRDLRFGGLMHVPPLRVDHQLLRELANNFKLGENRLKTGYGSFQITPKTIGDALGINATATDSDTSTSDSETQQDSEDSARKHPIKKGKKMDSRKRKQMQEESDSDSESESEPSDESEESSPAEKEKKKKKTKTTPKKTQPKKKKVVVEDSPPKEDQYFDGETYEISSDELDEWLGQNVDKSAAEGENQPDLRSTEGRYVSSETIPAVNLGSDGPSSQGHTEQSSKKKPFIILFKKKKAGKKSKNCKYVFVPASQTTTETDFEPTPMLQIEGTTETTPETPKQLQETTPTVPPAPTKIHPDAEDAATLLMMARAASYVPKTDPGVPSFSLGLTDSSQEGASTQETEREKSPEAANLIEQLDSLVQRIASSAAKGKNTSPQIQRETGGESSAKFETPGGMNQIPDDMKQKCYIWGMRLKEDADGNTNEYEEMCTLIGQGEYILMRMHLASLQAKSGIESQIVSAICLILNNKNEKRFKEQIYCLPPDIVCMALSDHPNGKFVSPKTKKEFRVEAYPSFIPFIDRKKLTSHPYIFAPVCYSGHWWLWLIKTRKRKCQILDPLHKKAPTDERKAINKFTGYVFSRLITYAGGEPLQKGEREKEIKSPYVKISGQKTSYDCAVYVMK
ncbi:hypothetical protein Ahy_B03g067465 isoform B [Arachis hypogaea]|uniref:Ubiquitin-like protease family profile domain-containing protein n=1 Tax=Arachis hypogaea TaxID=3818 RepID=A0A445A6V4_ARAHY|nr:hypothetical protein Ahy_B03g067465 isoform B [Arachis hypogaea]